MPLEPGTRLGPYEVTSLLGAGGMGEVYRAFFLGWLGWAYGCAGRRADAEAVLRELQERGTTEYVAPPFLGAIHAALGEVDQAFECLERGFTERNTILMWFRWPLWDLLWTDPRYDELMKRLGLGSS